MSTTAAPSGKFLVRVPRSLHAQLVEAARREGVSLNQFVATALAGAVSWRRDDAHHEDSAAA